MHRHDRENWLRREADVARRIAAARNAHPGPWSIREACPSVRQRYFVLRAGGETWVGRQTGQTAPGVPASAIRWEDLLGPGFRFALGERQTDLVVTLATEAQARAQFDSASADPSADLVFPFPVLDGDGHEWTCPPHYWHLASAVPGALAADEALLRAACADVLAAHLPDSARVHDPACSTGDFVAAMAAQCPWLHFSGSDIAPAMVDVARLRHAGTGLAFDCHDAASLPQASVDALLLRFLNAEVVTQRQASALFRRLTACVRPDGIAVVFGHSPVALPVREEAAALGWEVLRCSVAPAGAEVIAPFYVLRAPWSS